MKKFDETYERLLEQHRLDESFIGSLAKAVKLPFKALGAVGKAYGKAIIDPIKNSKIGQAFSSDDKTKPSEKKKGIQAILEEIKVIIDETSRSSAKQLTFKYRSENQRFLIEHFYKKEEELVSDVAKRLMKIAKIYVSSMDFSSMVDNNPDLIKNAIKTVTSDEKWKQENKDVKVNENEILSEIKKILKAQISRANTKIKFDDKLVWLYLLAPSTQIIGT